MDTKKGSGQAMFLIDYGPEHDLHWVVFLDESRQCWTFSNRDVLAQENFTLGRNKPGRNLSSLPPSPLLT